VEGEGEGAGEREGELKQSVQCSMLAAVWHQQFNLRCVESVYIETTLNDT